jgi:hypothetical protein
MQISGASSMNLSSESFEKAVAFIKAQADPLEQALFAYEFDNGRADDVLKELGKSQNDDGGYRGLEPDAVTVSSTALDTSRAFQILRALGAPADHPQVQAGVKYWLNTLDTNRRTWPLKPDATPDTVGATWWKAKDLDELLERFNGCRGNPKAEVVGYLHDYASLVDDFGLVTTLTQETVAHLESQPENMDQDELICYPRLFETKSLDKQFKDRILAKLSVAFPASLSPPERWGTYNLRPLWVVERPDDPLLDFVDSELVESNIRFKIERQEEDGRWGPFWHWDKNHPAEWEQAKRSWSGILTLRTLVVLRNFGRIEGYSNS